MATKPIGRTFDISAVQENSLAVTMSEIEMALNKLFGDVVSLSRLSAFLRLIMFVSKESSNEGKRKDIALLQRLYNVLDPLNKREYMSEDDIQVELPLLYTELIDFLMQYSCRSDSSCEQGSDSVFLSVSMQKHLAKADSIAGFVNVTLNDAFSVVSPEGFMSSNSDCERYEGVGAGGNSICRKDPVELLNDIEELKYKNQRLNDENVSLQKLLANEEDSNMKLQAENETLKKFVHVYQDELEKLRAEENQLDELRKMFQRENEYRIALESKLIAWEKERAQHIKELGELKIAFANVGCELESTKKREKEVSKALIKSKRACSDLREHKKKLSNQCIEMQNKSLVLEKKLEEASKINNVLVQEKKQLEEEISKLNSRTRFDESTSELFVSDVTLDEINPVFNSLNQPSTNKQALCNTAANQLTSPSLRNRRCSLPAISLFSELQDAMKNDENDAGPILGRCLHRDEQKWNLLVPPTAQDVLQWKNEKSGSMVSSITAEMETDTPNKHVRFENSTVLEKETTSTAFHNAFDFSFLAGTPMSSSTPVSKKSSFPRDLDNEKPVFKKSLNPRERKLQNKVSNLEAKLEKEEREKNRLSSIMEENQLILSSVLSNIQDGVKKLENLNVELTKNLDNVEELEKCLRKEHLICGVSDHSTNSKNVWKNKSSDNMRDQLTMELKALRTQIAKSQAVVAYLQSKGHIVPSGNRNQSSGVQDRQILYRGTAEPDLAKYVSNTVLTHLLSGDVGLTSAVHRIRTRSPTSSPGSGSLYQAYLSYSCPILPSLNSVVNRATQTDIESIGNSSDRNDYLVPSLHQLRAREALRTSHAQSSKESDESQCYSEPVCLQSSRRPFLTVPCSAFSSVTHVSEEDTAISPTIPRNRSFSFVAAIKKGNPRLVDAQSKHTRSRTHGTTHSKSLGNVYYDARDTPTLPPLPPPPHPRETALFWSRTQLNTQSLSHWRSQNIPSSRSEMKVSRGEAAANIQTPQHVSLDDSRQDDVLVGEDYTFMGSQSEGIHTSECAVVNAPLSRYSKNRSFVYFSEKRRRRSEDMPTPGNITLQVPKANVPTSGQQPISNSDAAIVTEPKSSNTEQDSHLVSGGGDASSATEGRSRPSSGMSKVVETPEEEDDPGIVASAARSNMDAATASADNEAFPSFTDAFLMKLNLHKHSECSPENLSEQDVETKFSNLALAFKTDKFTLSKRLEIHKRQRDIAEKNAEDELKALRESLNALNQMCTDYQMRELITKIQHHVDVIHQSTLRVSSRAEMYGAVQEEQRMSNAFEVIVMHAENLKHLREKEHGELEEARRLLMDSQFITEEGNGVEISSEDGKFQRTIRSLSSSNMSKSEPRSRVHSTSCVLGSSGTHVGGSNCNSSGRLYIHANSLSCGSSQVKTRRCSLPVGPAYSLIAKAALLPPLTITPAISSTSGTTSIESNNNTSKETLKNETEKEEINSVRKASVSSTEMKYEEQNGNATAYEDASGSDSELFKTVESMEVPTAPQSRRTSLSQDAKARRGSEKRLSGAVLSSNWSTRGLQEVCSNWRRRWSNTIPPNQMVTNYLDLDSTTLIRKLRVAFSVSLVMVACMCLFYSIMPNAVSSCDRQPVYHSLEELLATIPFPFVEKHYPKHPPV